MVKNRISRFLRCDVAAFDLVSQNLSRMKWLRRRKLCRAAGVQARLREQAQGAGSGRESETTPCRSGVFDIGGRVVQILVELTSSRPGWPPTAWPSHQAGARG